VLVFERAALGPCEFDGSRDDSEVGGRRHRVVWCLLSAVGI
jgi:hypothetical protein